MENIELTEEEIKNMRKKNIYLGEVEDEEIRS